MCFLKGWWFRVRNCRKGYAEPTIGVYYYPWHDGDFHGRQYLRERLVPPQLPELGEYDDRRPEVIAQHLAWSRHAGIEVWATSWWGQGSREDNTTRTAILPRTDLGSVRIAVMYETTGTTNNFTDYSGIRGDFTYLAEHYFPSRNYFKIDGRPVVVVYLTRVLARRGVLGSVVTDMRAGAADHGFDVFIIGDHAFGNAGSTGGFDILDAITNYDVYGAMGVGGYATREDVDRYAGAQEGWRHLATDAGIAFVPSATPGFNDTAVRSGHDPLSRSLSGPNQPGSLFRALLEAAVPRDDRAGGLVLITSWNEWHEDTQVEPVAAAPPTATDNSPSGNAYTRGLWYEGYETRYLDILHEVLPIRL